MLVSVIITTYRRKPLIVTRALRSVMKQTFPDIEIIVVDDSPIDYEEKEAVRQEVLNTCKVVRYFSTGGNKGAPVARNKGIYESTGDYIAFLDDDDEWLPEKIERQLEGFNSDEIGLVYSRFIIKNEIDGSEYARDYKCYSGRVRDYLLREGNFIGSTSVPLIKKTCLQAIGGFDESLESGQDYDLYIRLAEKYEVNFIIGDYAIYHIYAGERITTNALAKLHGEMRLIEKYSDDLERIPQAKARRYRFLVKRYSALDKRKNAFMTWAATVKMNPMDVFGNLKYFLYAILPCDSSLIRVCIRLKSTIKKVLKRS